MPAGENIINEGSQKVTLRERGICVVIPTYNNVGTIADVVTRACEQCADVIVVSDGSDDGTLELLQGIGDITIVSYPRNKGKGEALKQGFKKALELGFSYAITLDADGQHFPEDIPVMLKANILHPGALIIGQRKGLESIPRSFGSRFANAFSNFWFCVQTGQYLKDTQSGFRLYPLKKIVGLNFLTSRYEAELELLVFMCWHGVDVVSQQVNVYYPPKEERVSHFRPGPDFTRIFILNTCLCVLALVYGLPLKLWRGLTALLRTAYSLLFYLIVCLLVLLPYTFLLNIMKVGLEEKSARLHRLLYKITRFITCRHGIPGVKYSVMGDAGQFDKPAVVICNHQSHLDLMLMLSQTEKMVVLTNDWVWNSPFYGYVLRNAEYYPVSYGIETIMPKLQSLAERGYCIAIYPEGTRSKNCQIERFHKGAFHIAEALRLDILPLIEYGAGRVLPKGGKYLRKGEIRLQVNQRIPFEEYQKFGDNQKVASWFRRYYKKEYSSICNQLDQNA